MTHDIQVNGYNIVPDCVDVGTKGSYGNEKLQFNLSEQWKGLTVKVSFFPPNSVPVVVILGGVAIDVPPEVTRNGGKSRYMISGHADGKLMKSLIGYLNLQNTLEVATTPPSSPTPTEMEQVYDWMQEALDMAQSVRIDADNGEFDGKDGETPVFSVGEVKKGEEPELTITGTILNPVLNIVLPIGNTGHTGATGDTGATFTPNVSENGIISWDNDKELPNPPERDITGPIGPAGVVIGVPPDNDPLKRVWVDPDGEALINEVIDNLIEESTIARDESVEAKGITLEAKDETLEARDETVTARDDAEAFAEQTALDRTATGADRTATGEDRAAVNTALSGFATDTLPDAVQAIEDKADAEITRVGQAGNAQVQAVEQVGGEQMAAAMEQADRAESEADKSTTQATKSKSYAVGGTDSREDEDIDNALYYKNQAQTLKDQAEIARDEAKDYAESIYLWQKAPTLETMDFAIMLYPPPLASI